MRFAEKREILLKPLGWRCDESVVFACPIHENDQVLTWRDDHYPVCRLDIRQDSEFATG